MLDIESTGQHDKEGRIILLGDTVRRYDGPDYFEGKVVFANCAFRILITKNWDKSIVVDGSFFLKYNKSLLFDENKGTSHVEVIKRKCR